jgi:hypothetical protein
MTANYFNSLGGFSVGIPEVPLADANGNIITNVLTSGNVTANVVYASDYKYANGQPFNASPGGANTQLQYNNNGAFAGIPNATWNGNVLTLGNVSNVSIRGGVNGYFLQTDGAGTLSWAPGGNGSGGNGTPGGANTQVQFNDSGNFGGVSGFTFNKLTGNLLVPNNVSTGNVSANYFIGNGSYLTGITNDTANYVIKPTQANITSVGTLTSLTVSGTASLGSVSNVKITGGINGYVLTTDGAGNLTWQAGGGGGGGSPGGTNSAVQFNDNGVFGGSDGMTFNKYSNALAVNGNVTVKNITSNNNSIYGNANVSGNVNATYFNGNGAYLTGIVPNSANYVVQPVQSNITSVGTLTSLTVSGNILSGQFISAAAFQTSGPANVGTIQTTGLATIGNGITVSGNTNLSTSGNITLGSIGNIHIAGGLNGYFLQTDGLGNLTWAPGGGGGGGSPGGGNTQIQYNSNGTFAGSAYFTFDSNTDTVQIGGQLIANSMQLGSGTYKFGTSSVYFATTASTAKQVLYSIPVTQCSGVDFEIIGTDSIGLQRQSLKISSLYYAGIVTYNEYAGLYINGGVGTFGVEYNPGNILVNPSLDLTVTPDTTNSTVYKMLITVLAP